jgi:hypothetical protein
MPAPRRGNENSLVMSRTKGAAALFVFVALTVATSFGAACGIERWSVKMLTDADHTKIVKTPRQSSVHELLGFPKLAKGVLHAHETSRISPPEFHIVIVRALLLGYRHERNDKDFHLVLANPDDQSETIIGELPDPTCVANATFAHGLTVMRGWMVSTFGAPGRATVRLPQPVPVLVRGVVFYDFIHGQDGVAPNGIEIHPILRIGPAH